MSSEKHYTVTENKDGKKIHLIFGEITLLDLTEDVKLATCIKTLRELFGVRFIYVVMPK